ncbi:hypothetical protein Csac_2100 [Caldicellulosiruptor saccharolyticus DSM 8903]|uniref:Transcription regulator TrmB N-terminal domain-containing protein n=1 Tax=Caldicellulosiruptor saccharolyticus (strain ATCC 43494 / DSM 8903 / Tp8T 6331) TaxID=351627 RepID=A4XL98_CALS8|nr:helix-turn-helix domain-containing protein [Caldicellulosiruptor saccharolyticus]ABP67683.1 hypothetical protein Csac_2100 [Caldicellulosiruptor saccharolyticus DSM 8903]
MENKVYEYVKNNTAVTPKEIAKNTGLKEGSIISALHRLVEKGLVIKISGYYSLSVNSNSKNNNTATVATSATPATLATVATDDKSLQDVADNLQRSKKIRIRKALRVIKQPSLQMLQALQKQKLI